MPIDLGNNYKYQELLMEEKANGNLNALLVMICGKRFESYRSRIASDYESFELKPTYILDRMKIDRTIVTSNDDDKLQTIKITMPDIPVQTIALPKKYPGSETNVCREYANVVDIFFKSHSFSGYSVIPTITGSQCDISLVLNKK